MADQPGGESTGTVVLALALNAVIAIAKAIGGALSGSGAMMSEAAHSIADTLNEAFLLTALKRSDRPADVAHPFGYGMERFFWALLAAVGIFVSGAVFSFFEGYRTLTEPSGDEGGFLVPYVVLGIAFVMEGTSWLKAVRQVRREAREADQDIVTHLRRSDDPTVKTVASEDSAALVGLVLAFLGILLHQLTGNPVFDGLASLLIGCVLTWVAYALGRDSKGLLIGEAAGPEERQRLYDHLVGYPEVDDVVDLLTMRIGTGRLLVAVRLDFAADISSDQLEQASTRIERDLKDRFPDVVQVFLDATGRGDTAARAQRRARQRLQT